MQTVTETIAQVLGRLGAGQTLRLRRSGPAGTVEVHARIDGALEVPTAVLGIGGKGATGSEGPHVLYGRHRVGELAAQLVAAIDDLELVTSSIVDASGVERLLDGSGARTDVTVDGHLDRWDLPLIDQVRRYLSQRFTFPLSELTSQWSNIIYVSFGRVPHIFEVLQMPRRIRIAAVVVHDIPGSEQLDLTLHRLNPGDGLVRLRHHGDKVLAEVVLPAPTFMGQHVDVALDAIIGIETFLATEAVVREFGGEASIRKRYRPKLSDIVDPDDPRYASDTTDPSDTSDPSDRSDNDDTQEEDR